MLHAMRGLLSNRIEDTMYPGLSAYQEAESTALRVSTADLYFAFLWGREIRLCSALVGRPMKIDTNKDFQSSTFQYGGRRV